MSGTLGCPFCDRITRRTDLISLGRHTAVLADGFPISAGHCLVTPIRHGPDLFSLTDEERAEVWAEVARSVKRLRDEHEPDGINVGVNVGPAAGQTVPHAHVHVIPRYEGDVPDPRGGVRWVLPERAAYWND